MRLFKPAQSVTLTIKTNKYSLSRLKKLFWFVLEIEFLKKGDTYILMSILYTNSIWTLSGSCVLRAVARDKRKYKVYLTASGGPREFMCASGTVFYPDKCVCGWPKGTTGDLIISVVITRWVFTSFKASSPLDALKHSFDLFMDQWIVLCLYRKNKI
jgi:hypothetical protein